MSRIFRLVACVALAMAGIHSPAAAQLSMAPGHLEHYSHCVNQAKDRNLVFVLERGTKYRCEDDIAVSYFNYLGHKHIGLPRAQEFTETEATGVFVYRVIAGIGRCWNMVADAYGQPVSFYGCDIYVEL